MQKRTPPLRIDDEHSWNEYRIHAGRVELRTSSFGQTGDWRQLGADEVIMHLILGTPVARWLLLRWKQELDSISHQFGSPTPNL